MSVTCRPMREADLRPAFDLQLRAFVDLDGRRGSDDVGAPPASRRLSPARGLLGPVAALVQFVTARQRWAVDVCAEARLELEADGGCVFAGGDVGPLSPYLPSGAYL